ncbi:MULTISPECIES: transposase [unclassified Microcoleus]|uniref:transposase n=1 Tax=unclassified Microcoleus TaxID=2642155 RepID=UPI00312BA9AB
MYEQNHEPTIKSHEVVGVDLGVKELATLSTGVVFPNPKHYKSHQAKLKRLSRVLARKVKGSGNRQKAKVQLRKHHAKIANRAKKYSASNHYLYQIR